jgi:hypothetical protein
MKSFIFTLLSFLVFGQSFSSAQEVAKKPSELLVEGRLTDLQACVNVHDTILVINYWDCAVEDNDTVSLNLNGTWILQRIRLTNARKELRIKVQPGENYLTLFAHNLGDLPNNTAAMSVREQYANQEIKMTSNLLVSGTTRIACYIGDPGILMTTLSPCIKKELNTAAADDVKNEIRLYEEKVAQANKPKVTQTSNPQRNSSTHTSNPRPSRPSRPKPPVNTPEKPSTLPRTPVSLPKTPEKTPAPAEKKPTQKGPCTSC